MHKKKINLTFFFLILICLFSLKSFASNNNEICIENNPKDFLDTTIVKDRVFYNSDSAAKKGINTKRKRIIRGGMPFYGLGIVIIAAAVNSLNFELSRGLAVVGLGVVGVGAGTFMRQSRYSDAEKINELLEMDLEGIKKRFGSKPNYLFVKKQNSQYLTFKHIETVLGNHTHWVKGVPQSHQTKSKVPREYEVYFDQNGKVNFARFRYYKLSYEKGWRESKRI